MPKRNVTARIPENIHQNLTTLIEVTGRSQSELINEAIAQYLGEEVETVGDRLANLEREVDGLKRQQQGLLILLGK